ncbi:MAG: hypothetical protein LBI86_09370 [Treponema sp.]|nr:hypothetical protein [Treponema sp.]
MSRSRTVNPVFFIQLALGVYFAVLGIEGITSYQSRGAQILRLFGQNRVLDLVVAIVFLVAGIYLVISLLAPIDRNLYFILNIIVFVIWIIYIVLSLFVNNFLKPNFLPWLGELAWKCVILSSVWLVGQRE